MIKKRLAVAATAAGCVGMLMGTVLAASRVKGDDDKRDVGEESRVEVGLEIAPVHLRYPHHERRLVGLGSYLVNAVIGCNGCHSAGPATEYSSGHNPFQRLGAFAPPKIMNPATYLGGGRDFGQIGPITSPTVPPHIVSRNLTPDQNGVPVGGFAEFFESMRSGVDHDQLHPNCDGTSITSDCFNPPFDGRLLQVMPWPELQELTDEDLRAIYTYLTAVPCVATADHNCF